MSFDALEPTNRGLTPAWRSSQVSTSPWRRWASPGCLLSPPTLLEARHHAGPRTQWLSGKWLASEYGGEVGRVYIWPGKYYILNTDFILHSLVCVAMDANYRNMDLMVFICCQALTLASCWSASHLTTKKGAAAWPPRETEGDTAYSLIEGDYRIDFRI